MSKSNMLLGLAKGKVGDLVFYRDGGEQRTRTRVIPKNPRTEAQMTQRVKLANVMPIFRAFAPWIRESFSSRRANQSGFNAFSAAAIAISPYLTKEMATAGVGLPMPCMMSKGVLQQLPFQEVQVDGENTYALRYTAEVTESTTVGQLSAALIQQYPLLANGDKLNFLYAQFVAVQDADAGVDRYDIINRSSSLVLDVTSTELLSDAGVEVVENYLFASQHTSLSASQITMYAVFTSRVDADGKLLTSTSYASMSDAAQSLYDGYRTENSRVDAIQSYKASESQTLR